MATDRENKVSAHTIGLRVRETQQTISKLAASLELGRQKVFDKFRGPIDDATRQRDGARRALLAYCDEIAVESGNTNPYLDLLPDRALTVDALEAKTRAFSEDRLTELPNFIQGLGRPIAPANILEQKYPWLTKTPLETPTPDQAALLPKWAIEAWISQNRRVR